MTAENPATPSDFEEIYRTTPPWDIGRPQPVFLALAEAGELRGTVLDSGCGTGEHALMAAALGHEATGIDLVAAAIDAARRKAAERRIDATFVVGDILRLDVLGKQFDTVIDSGVFHVFDDADRSRYVDSLGSVVAPGGRYFMACFSDRQPGDWGPRRVTRGEIEASFAHGWDVESIEPAEFLTNLVPKVHAWLARVTRV
ncbi:MAG TPA: class I SAM-dependent methyltransferase [Acidimicrobiales bacterium]|nr:class I SAM-dependent methyltransferase [Acidimicrobiales bacterium]